MEVVLKAQQSIDPESNQQGAAQFDQHREFEVTAEGFRALRGLEDRHGQTNRNRRAEKEERQRGRVPERMQLAWHDQIERSERTLVQGGEQDAQDDQHGIDFLNPLDWSLQVEALQHIGKEFEEEHSGVGHYADPDLEHDRVRVHVDELMPDVPGAAKIEQQPNDEKYIAQERRQHRRAHNAVQSLNVEQVDRTNNAEATRGQHDSTQEVEADPEPPGTLVSHV